MENRPVGLVEKKKKELFGDKFGDAVVKEKIQTLKITLEKWSWDLFICFKTGNFNT